MRPIQIAGCVLALTLLTATGAEACRVATTRWELLSKERPAQAPPGMQVLHVRVSRIGDSKEPRQAHWGACERYGCKVWVTVLDPAPGVRRGAELLLHVPGWSDCGPSFEIGQTGYIVGNQGFSALSLGAQEDWARSR